VARDNGTAQGDRCRAGKDFEQMLKRKFDSLLEESKMSRWRVEYKWACPIHTVRKVEDFAFFLDDEVEPRLLAEAKTSFNDRRYMSVGAAVLRKSQFASVKYVVLGGKSPDDREMQRLVGARHIDGVFSEEDARSEVRKILLALQ
jgi:hypothetical protein